MKISILSRIEQFFFRPVPTTGFGLLRITFAGIVFLSFLLQWQDITTYYSDVGLVPIHSIPDFLRTDYRFSIFDFIGDPTAIVWIYDIFLLALLCVMVGIFTRPALFLSVFLLFSFHERLWAVLAGGDTMLRMLGFILLLSPCHKSFSVWSLRTRFSAWNETGKDPVKKIAQMSAWPYYLLLWQFIVIYVTAAWTKMLGSMWWDGSAISIALRHPFFSRVPLWFLPIVDHTAWLVSHVVLVSQFAWILFLVVPLATGVIPSLKKSLARVPWRLFIIGANAIVHLLIAIMMDVGLFSYAMIAGYLGLLQTEDFVWLKRLGKKMVRGTTVVLYDGTCLFCRKAAFVLRTFDWIGALSFVDYHEEVKRKKIAPRISFKALDTEMHVKSPDGSFTKGFEGFRTLSWKLPPLWILAPALYVPGIKIIGEKIYKRVASQRCGEVCARER